MATAFLAAVWIHSAAEIEKKHFDNIIYLEDFEKYHFKAAILARNRYCYMADYAQIAVCYVNHAGVVLPKLMHELSKKV